MTTTADMLLKVKTIIEPYVQEQKAFENMTKQSSFIDDLGINSANLVDIILDVEDAYDIEIDNDSMEKMLTVGAAMEVIQEKLAGK